MPHFTRLIFFSVVLAVQAVCAFAVDPAGTNSSGRPVAPITWISSTPDKPWQRMPDPSPGPDNPGNPAEVQVTPGKTFQTIDGFGGCFNELGWVALGKASPDDRNQVLAALFGNDGCAFNLGRLPIGSSDFALDAYSLDDTAGDLELRNFSIERDKKQLLPFVKAAMAVRPTLRCWGSPWSPPAWMKTNNNYSKGSLKWEPAILRSYATYLARWVDAHRAAGVNVYGVTPQNEPNILNVYPTCLWSGAQLREFIANYLGPALSNRRPAVELWLGLNGDPFNGGENPDDRLATVLGDPAASRFVTGVGFQYDSRNQIALANERYPDKKLMQSETECESGNNSWADAQKLFALMKRFFDGGANAYFLWNMVLDDTGMGAWKWRQNAPITVNRTSGKVTYNGEYYVMRHFSEYVKPGAKRVATTGVWGDKIAFVNPDGSTVLVVGNSLVQSFDVSLAVEGRADSGTLRVKLPAQSINTFILSHH